jgi:membrane-bound lytic murein transglycosylase D
MGVLRSAIRGAVGAIVVALVASLALPSSGSAATHHPAHHATKHHRASHRRGHALSYKSRQASRTASIQQGTKIAAAAAPGSDDFAAGRLLLDAQDTYKTAQAAFGKHQYQDAVDGLEPAIRRLNDAMTSAADPRIRNAAGDLLARCGSLRLAAVTRRDRDLGVPPAISASEATKPANGVAATARNTAADSAIALAQPPTPAPAVAIPLPDGDEGAPDEAGLAQPALEDDPNTIPVADHPLVDKWLDYFTGRGRPVFERWLNRSGLYMDSMKKALEKEGVPTDLVHLVFIESGFNPAARSYASAVGPWQFMRGTAKIFGLTVNSWVDERRDPEASTAAAAQYLKHLYGLFNSWPLAIASYNAGEGVVIDAVKRQGTKDFWSLRLPEQTRQYVPEFMAVCAIAHHPKRYRFDSTATHEPITYDEVRLPGSVGLGALATACGTTVDEIKRLNPAFLRDAAKAHGDTLTVRVPDGSGEKLMASLHGGTLDLPTVDTPDDPAVLRHKVRHGESLKSVGQQYGVSALAIARYNRIGRHGRLRVGRTLLIPMYDGGGGKVASRAGRHAGAATGRATRTVRVKMGDTLSGIAGRHGTTVAELRALNNLPKDASVRAGQKLKVPAES